MKKSTTLAGPIMIFTVGVAALLYAYVGNSHTPAKNPDPNHAHADFAVWIDGNKPLDFSGDMFMSKELTPAEEEALKHATGSLVAASVRTLRKYLHLHDGNGHVIHRHKPGLTLGAFFSTLPWAGSGYVGNVYHLADSPVGDEAFAVRLFVNGVENPAGASYVFKDGDHLLITVATDATEVSRELKLMTDDACLYSRTCPWRGKAPTEHCIADPNVPCTQ